MDDFSVDYSEFQDEFECCPYSQDEINLAFMWAAEADEDELAAHAARAGDEHARVRKLARSAGLSLPHISPVSELVVYGTGAMIKLHVPGNGVQVGGGKRGVITGFSRASRWRLQQKVAMTERSIAPLFLTLTYPDKFPEDASEWGRHMDIFGRRMGRKGWGCIWRKEFQDRKSGSNVGKIAPHFHCLVWGVSYAELLTWAAVAWYQIVGSGDVKHLMAGTRVEELRSTRGVRGYVSKYLAKVDEKLDELASGCGRMWGVLNEAAIPWSPEYKIECTNADVVKLLRLMRRYARMRSRSRGGCTVLCNAPEFWLDRFDDMVT